ncbi:Asp23/Gls24 family envelope stress response protein [Paeniglutamicibacter kerguelensis]|uniref:Alkaline shock family protein YloU n=1 Tax=Paeniglutamicibacter kerguelensis TaxID=254788 RepID=A0ABS4XKK6_9MICC|nr:Asp23/Gls24 family envelope stress response protein [Paeniglutamicibacter kerguelensis]MBP2388793.1 putative alkaline shock family protein YloU [Paeniglutamicibacter kerguelensis]
MVEPLDHDLPLRGAQPAGASGTTKLTDLAIAKVAAGAARDIPGVHALGLGTSRALGAIRDAVGSTYEPAHGVSVEVGTTQVAIDIVLTASFGVPLHELASKVRESVFAAVQELTGLQVIEVNIEIGDVHIPVPDERTAKQHEPRRVEHE